MRAGTKTTERASVNEAVHVDASSDNLHTPEPVVDTPAAVQPAMANAIVLPAQVPQVPLPAPQQRTAQQIALAQIAAAADEREKFVELREHLRRTDPAFFAHEFHLDSGIEFLKIAGWKEHQANFKRSKVGSVAIRSLPCETLITSLVSATIPYLYSLRGQ